MKPHNLRLKHFTTQELKSHQGTSPKCRDQISAAGPCKHLQQKQPSMLQFWSICLGQVSIRLLPMSQSTSERTASQRMAWFNKSMGKSTHLYSYQWFSSVLRDIWFYPMLSMLINHPQIVSDLCEAEMNRSISMPESNGSWLLRTTLSCFELAKQSTIFSS